MYGQRGADGTAARFCPAFQILLAGSGRIPTDEMELAAHLYIGIQAFFARHAGLQRRPLFITGESYAGKYVPSIGMRWPVSFTCEAHLVRRANQCCKRETLQKQVC